MKKSVFALYLILPLMVAMSLFSLAFTAGNATGTRKGVLPTRPTAMPIVTTTPDDTSSETEESPPDGALIELRIDPPWPELWTMVQWQDPQGDWYNVDGWRGASNEEGRVLWWVAKEDLGTGPFRWLVYEEKDGRLLVTSESFDLPAHRLQVVVVEVTVP